jgi:hypothetical protein
MDRIRMESGSDNIFYHILPEYKYEFECYQIWMQNGYLDSDMHSDI